MVSPRKRLKRSSSRRLSSRRLSSRRRRTSCSTSTWPRAPTRNPGMHLGRHRPPSSWRRSRTATWSAGSRPRPWGWVWVKTSWATTWTPRPRASPRWWSTRRRTRAASASRSSAPRGIPRKGLTASVQSTTRSRSDGSRLRISSPRWPGPMRTPRNSAAWWLASCPTPPSRSPSALPVLH